MTRKIFLCICFIRLGQCWNLNLIRGGIVYQDPLYLNAYLNVTRYNHTNYAIVAKGEFFKDIPCKAKVDIRLLGQFSNVYKELPVKIVRTLEDVYKYEYKFVAAEIRPYTNLPEDCPIRKGNYYIREFNPNLELFKKNCPVVPWSSTSKFLLDYKNVIEGKVIFQINFYAEITKDDEYDKQK